MTGQSLNAILSPLVRREVLPNIACKPRKPGLVDLMILGDEIRDNVRVDFQAGV